MAGYRPRNTGNRTASRVGPTVARRLRASGWNISPAARKHRQDGVFVSAQDDRVSILFDTGLADRNQKAASRMAAEIGAWAETTETATHDSGDFVIVSFNYSK